MNICKKINLYKSVLRNVISVAMPRDKLRRNVSTSMLNRHVFNMEEEREEFYKSLQGCIDEQLSKSILNEKPETRDRMKLILNENVTGGKYYRGVATVLAYKCIETPENLSNEKMKIALNLGWCTEMLQSYLVILDDLMDGSKMRRGKPCWYLREDTGQALAINDSIFLYGFMMEVLKNNVGHLPNYAQFVNIFNETLLYTSIGQYLDIATGHKKKDYSLFTADSYNDIVKYKTAYYTYKLPITLSLLLADQMNTDVSKAVEDISLSLGMLFQIQDDYIDCFGDESITGKIGTDIQEGKCSWLAVKALERSGKKQLTVFTACYGSKEPAHIERVKQLYRDLQIPRCYKEHENAIYRDLLAKIQTVNLDGLRKVFQKLLEQMYNRQN